MYIYIYIKNEICVYVHMYIFLDLYIYIQIYYIVNLRFLTIGTGGSLLLCLDNVTLEFAALSMFGLRLRSEMIL